MTKSQVYTVVYSSILWQSTPLQAVVDGHTAGGRAGQQSGDVSQDHVCLYPFSLFFSLLSAPLLQVVSSYVNENFSIVTRYASGQCLSDLRSDVRNSAMKGEIRLVFAIQCSV